MTAVWGPLGWITLHSISVNYPEVPSTADKLIVKKFIDLFAETIACPSCKGDFMKMYRSYTSRNTWLSNSRYELFLFIVRAHNTVNKKIDKPCPATVSEALESLRSATKHKSPAEYRASYISYLYGNWSRMGGGEGFIQTANVREIQKINNEYWNLRETGFSLSFPEADVLQLVVPVPTFISPYTQKITTIQPTETSNNQGRVGLVFKDGRLKLANR